MRILGKTIISTAVLAGVAGAAFAGTAVQDAIAPAAVRDVRLSGRAGESADACIRARAYSDWARGDMYEECVNAFRIHKDDRGGWQNEYWGKTMLCFAGAADYMQDAALKAWIVEHAHAFLKEFQRPNGYLATYSNEDDVGRNQWRFNIWGRKYTFWALISIRSATLPCRPCGCGRR
jgi:hypothetical protein